MSTILLRSIKAAALKIWKIIRKKVTAFMEEDYALSLSVEEDYALLTYFQSASSSSSVVAAAGETDQAKLQAACKQPHELLLYLAKPSQAASRIYALWADHHWSNQN